MPWSANCITNTCESEFSVHTHTGWLMVLDSVPTNAGGRKKELRACVLPRAGVSTQMTLPGRLSELLPNLGDGRERRHQISPIAQAFSVTF